MEELKAELQQKHFECKKEGNGDSCYFLGRAYVKGIPGLIGISPEFATKYFALGCNLKNTLSCLTLAHLQEDPDARKEHFKKAMVCLSEDCFIKNQSDACLHIANIAHYELDDHKAAVISSYKAAEIDKELYGRGGDLLSDYPTVAADFYKKDCKFNKNGSSCAQYALFVNQYTPSFNDKFMKYGERACEYGNQEGCAAFINYLAEDNKKAGISIADKYCRKDRNANAFACELKNTLNKN